MEAGEPEDKTLPFGAAATAAFILAELPVVERAHYEFLAEHARGGLGRIIRARDRRTGRLVAIKEMLEDTPDAAARFCREALVTANLQHPAIVPVYELGRWPEGQPFYAMKLVAGRALDDALRDAATLPERLALLPRLIDVAEAMAYAHGEGVIHRDLKPANVLVGSYGETVVIDWGLARRVGDAELATVPLMATAVSASVTVAGDVLGTPVYMPPEQARGEDVDARADVYGLGAMLYHLLTGRVPYAESVTVAEVLARLVSEPPRPVAELEPAVPADLLAIVTKAMAPARDDRYASARELAADLRRFQTGQLVGAHAYSLRQLVRRWLRRHRAPLLVAALLTTALVVTAIVLVRGIAAERTVARRERVEADRQRALVEVRNNHLIIAQARGDVALDPTRALAWLKQLPPGAPEWAAARMIAADAGEHGVARWVLRGGGDNINDVEFTADDRALVSVGDDGVLRRWDLTTGIGRVIGAAGGAPIESLALTPDGAHAITIGPWRPASGRDIRIWDLGTGTATTVPPHPERDADLLLLPDGRSFVVITCVGTVRLVDVVTGAARQLRSPTPGPSPYCANALAVSPDGALVAAETGHATVDLISVADGKTVQTIETGARATVKQVAFTGDGARLLILTDIDLASWGLARGDRQTVVPNQGAVRGFEVVGDGSQLVLANTDRTLRHWTVTDGSFRVLARYDDDLAALVMTHDQRRVVIGGDDDLVRVVDIDGAVARVLRGHGRGITELALSHDGGSLASSSRDGTIRVWSIDGARRYDTSPDSLIVRAVVGPASDEFVVAKRSGCVERRTIAGVGVPLRPCGDSKQMEIPMVQTPDGRVLAVARTRIPGGVDLWTRPGTAPHEVAPGMPVAGLAVTDDGTQLAAVADDGAVRLIALPAGDERVLATPALARLRRRAIAIAPDGARVVWAEVGGALGVYAPGHASRSLPGTHGEVRELVLLAGGTMAVAVTATAVVRWDLASGAETVLGEIRGADNLVRSPTGDEVAISDTSAAIHVIDTVTGRRRTLRGHDDDISQLAYAPDGRALVSASWDATVRVWDLATDTSRIVPHEAPVAAATFTPDGARIITADGNGTLAIVQDDLPRDEAGLRRFLAAATNLEVDLAAP